MKFGFEYVSSGISESTASSIAVPPIPSARITRLPNFSAGKFPSTITISSPCPISQSVFNNSGDTIFGMFFYRAKTICRKFKTCFLKKAPNVRYSWGISRILNQNSVNSEFVKWRPRISRSPFFYLFYLDFLHKKVKSKLRRLWNEFSIFIERWPIYWIFCEPFSGWE